MVDGHFTQQVLFLLSYIFLGSSTGFHVNQDLCITIWHSRGNRRSGALSGHYCAFARKALGESLSLNTGMTLLYKALCF
jgi:hypothetical protein